MNECDEQTAGAVVDRGVIALLISGSVSVNKKEAVN